MSLTNEQILDLVKRHGFPPIETEATKPCVCGDSSLQGVFHRNDGPCYIAVEEATKPQEPVAWKWRRSATAKWESVPHWDSIEEMAAKEMEALEWEVVRLFTTPKPCPDCQSRANGASVLVPSVELKKMQAVIAGYERDQKELIFEQGDQAKVIAKQAERITELEAEDSAVHQLKDSTITRQAERIAELESEHEKSEEAWETLDMERVQYLNDVGDVLGQNNTDESLINAAKRVVAERDALREDRDEHLRVGTLALQERDALAMQNQQIQAVLARVERKLSAYVGVCKGDKELTDAILPMVHGARTLPDELSTEIIKRHDAAVMRKYADSLDDSISAWGLESLAVDMEKSCPPSN